MAYDVLIKGGRVIDPASETDRPLDVAIQGGRIAKVTADIDASEAARWVDARGKLVVPGLIDVHAHIFEHGSSNGLDPDLAGVRSGVTTIVDGGSAGSSNYAGFHNLVIQHAATRVLTNIHIAKAGLAFIPEARDANDILLDDTIAMIHAHPGEIIGVKVRACGPAVDAMGIAYIESALTAAHEGGVRLMVHIGDPQFGSDPTITRQLLPLLRPGDLLTHLFTGKPGKAIDDANRVLPELVDAKERGVLFDPAHGRWNLSFEVAKRLLDQDITPASISTDITKPGRDIVKSMTHTMGKFLALGFLAPGCRPHEHAGPRPHDRTGGGARLPRRGHDRRRDDSGRRSRQVALRRLRRRNAHRRASAPPRADVQGRGAAQRRLRPVPLGLVAGHGVVAHLPSVPLLWPRSEPRTSRAHQESQPRLLSPLLGRSAIIHRLAQPAYGHRTIVKVWSVQPSCWSSTSGTNPKAS